MVSLTDSEKIIMKCAWDVGDGFRLSQIMQTALERYDKVWKDQTVSTFLMGLTRKGYLERERQGRYYHYHILVDKGEYRSWMIRDDVTFWDDDDLGLFVSELLDQRTFTAKERRKLKQLVADKH